MIIKILGLLDIISAIMMALFGLGFSFQIISLFGLYLILKGIIFISFNSLLDILAGIFFILAGFSVGVPVITWIIVIWLVQKGLISLI